jgi:phage N-6-adenine-methyltransferase
MARLDKQFESATVEWSTPPDIFKPLNDEFGFTLDVAANSQNTQCKNFISKEQDGLVAEWIGVCWCNPPYGRDIKKWVKKAVIHTWDGVTTVMLIPVRSNTVWWHQLCIPFGEIRFVKGRPKFGGADKGLPWPLAVVVFRGKPSIIAEVLTCDICGKEITDFDNDLFHHTGKLHGEKNSHIHLCGGCHNQALMEIDFDLLIQQGII